MSASPVDIVCYNGKVLTMDEAAPTATAVAIAGGCIVAVGGDTDIRLLAGSRTRQVDMQGCTLLPGFFDSHFHFYQWSVGRTQMNLSPAQDFAGCMDMISRAAAQLSPGQWLHGAGFNETDWTGGHEPRMPTRKDLDAVAPENPALIYRCDLHLAVANSKALEQARVGPQTPDPEDGSIERDASGAPTGVLREGAITLVRDAAPEPTDAELERIMETGVAELQRMGVTAVHDVRLAGAVAESARTLRVWQRLRRKNALGLRCWAAAPAESLQEAVTLGLQSGLGDGRLRLGCVKFFFDGGMGARTAWMLEPFRDTGEAGVCLYRPDRLAMDVRTAHANGLAVMIHCIGDRAVREVTDMFERLYADADLQRERLAMPHRIEHAQAARPEDLQRLGRLPVAVSAQPTNMILDINMIEHCAPDQAHFTYPFRNMLDNGVELMFSSDAPVCDPNPLLGVQAAVTRARLDGTPQGGWRPEHKVSLHEALLAYTLTPARMHGAGDILGSVSPGKLADLVLLNGDLERCNPGDIAKLAPAATIFDGEIVFEKL